VIGVSTVSKQEFDGLCASLEQAVEELRAFSEGAASAEHAYRCSKAKAWSHVSKTTADGSVRYAAEVEAEVEALTADLRYVRDLQERNLRVSLESVRSRRQQLASLQAWMDLAGANTKFVEVDL
jgi:hypothetical protein